MGQFLQSLADINGKINDFVWVKVGLILLIGAGIIMTCCTKFFQVSHIGHWWKNTIGGVFKRGSGATKKTDKKSISQFQALCTALAATIGTGNIAGVAAAICIGGPGAVFWMWIAAFFGMMTNFSENVLGIYYRRRNKDGEWSGGAMYYLKDGLGGKKGFKIIGKILAVIFAICAILASFGIGNMGQVNKITLNVQSAFFKNVEAPQVMGVSVVSIGIGVVLMIIAGLIIIGGLQRIAAVAERIVPFMAILYVIGALVIVGYNYENLGAMVASIFKFAFGVKAVGGAVAGIAIREVITQGFKRGVFSNEAGLGSSVMVHSSSNVKEPVVQGMWGIFEVFFDTFVVCTITAVVVLSSGYIDLNTGMTVGNVDDATLVAQSFRNVFGEMFGEGFGIAGEVFVAVAMLLFAFTTVLGWSQYGSKAVEYLFGEKAVKVYKVIFVLMIISGAVMTSSIAWDISDTFNGMMMVPNLIGVVALCPVVAKITKNYVSRKIKNKDEKPILSYDADIQAESEEAIANGEN
ncbi:MAG: sodium:alanine symporter family protein [Clostridia bacterium]|nr:sodium:alanine symporter family protein [Clostridia bacterium]